MKDRESFLNSLYELTATNEERLAVREVYRFFFTEENHAIDRVFAEVDVDRITPSVAISMLMATVPDSAEFGSRPGFVERAAERHRGVAAEIRRYG